ncbi:MAG: hypothetical protein ACE5E3_03735 [Mariprofundus sp.]
MRLSEPSLEKSRPISAKQTLSSGKAPDAYDVHRAKRFISSQVSYGKQSKGLSAGAENIVKRLRRNLDQALDAQFPEYKKVNDVYGSARSAIDNIQRAAGSSVKMEGANADKALGTVLRRVLSNTQSRVNLIDSMAEVDQVLKTAGKKTGDDLVAQAMFADELDRMFGAAARTSLKGQVEQAVKTGAEAARGRTLADMAISGGAKLAEVARGINKENAIKSIEELLKRNMAGVK